ncbi:unnamed protein product [Didymodactylos carnosus]|uniref:Uncharacterized protein n=1 Tax=Didymodactylos carnosus TaxID=1234261 RepID=A0A8S2Y1Q9_9BILA|nr:unnamed protein product [Didymodactylos carnosus]
MHSSTYSHGTTRTNQQFYLPELHNGELLLAPAVECITSHTDFTLINYRHHQNLKFIAVGTKAQCEAKRKAILCETSQFEYNDSENDLDEVEAFIHRRPKTVKPIKPKKRHIENQADEHGDHISQ